MIVNKDWHGDIHTAISATIKQARDACDTVEFEFNGVTVRVMGGCNPDLVYRDWDRGMKGYLGENSTVGPFYSSNLTHEQLLSDANIEVENAAKRAEHKRKLEIEDAKKKRLLSGALSVAGPIELSDKIAWDLFVANNKDGYGGRVVRYAEEWARLMQVRIANGEDFPDFADDLSHLADDDGITGFMYGCAVQVLSKCWKHGEALRRWHNKDTQFGTEGDEANENGGVLNPALLSIC